MIWSWLRRYPVAVDVGVVCILLVPAVGRSVQSGRPAVDVTLNLLAILPLLWRRRWPVEVALAVAGVSAVIGGLGRWLLPFALAVALYTVASTRGRLTSAAVGAVSAAAMGAALAAQGQQFGDGTWRVVFVVAAWLLGDSVRSRRAYVREIEEKASRLEREREAQSERAVAQEQARIARELHDVIAHALSVVVVQAAAADDVFETDPQRAREPIRAIAGAARAALSDLRRVLGLLTLEAEYEPQPGLGSLDGLVERVRATGLDVTLEIDGAREPLPAAVDLSAYRIVQEALTNTLKHAGAGHATVRIRYGTELGLEIRDDGDGPAPANGSGTGGNGLIGMRERAAMLGGTVEAGPRPEGGYRVSARLPI